MGTTQLRQAKRHLLLSFLFVLGLCFAFTGMAMAQLDQGAINGVVKDSTGAVIPGAMVTLTNTDTNFILQGKTDSKGNYSFSPIKIGHYTVSASAPRFQTTTQQNVTVNIQDQLNISLTLTPGSALETVTVTSAPPMLQNENASVGQVVDTQTLNSTPLNGRNWVYIAQLTAGVAPGLSAGGARGGATGDFSANGQRTTQNNFILDGVDNNVNVDDFQNGASYNVRPPPDALAEFKLDTANYSAEYGHSAGAVVNASIKSGSNKIHGDLWEYVRNTAFDGADWNSAGGVVPTYHQNQFGATLGLPIWKNKLFYFGDLEANRITYAAPNASLTVPTASERNGDFSELFETSLTGSSVPYGMFAPNSGGQVPLTTTGGAYANPGGTCAYDPTNGYVGSGCSVLAYDPAHGVRGAGTGAPTTNVLAPGDVSVSGGQMDTVAQEILKDYPMPNTNGWTSANDSTPGSGKTGNNYAVNAPVKDNTFQWDQRLDWNQSAKDQAYARYSYTHEQTGFKPPLGPILDGNNVATGGFHGSTDFNLAQNFMASETHEFSSSLINEFRFGYNWGLYEFAQMNGDIPADVLVPGMEGVPFTGFAGPNGGLPYLRFAGVGGISVAGSRKDVPSTERQNVYQILDNVTKIHGSHSIKFGGELQSIRTSFAQATYPRGYYNFNGQYSSEHDATGAGISGTGTGMVDALNDNMGALQITPGYNTQYYRNYRAAYFQDDWKFNSKLTVNLGVRYDFIQPDSSKPGDLANFIVDNQGLVPGAAPDTNYVTGAGHYVLPAQVASSAPLSDNFRSLMASQNITIAYTNAHPNSLVDVQHYNFAPRIGLAYQFDAKTVLRAGYGLFYGAIEAPGGAELETNYPFAYTAVLYNPYLGNYGMCYPTANTGYQNINSGCPSNGTADLAEPNPPNHSPGYSIPPGWSPFPYPTTIETGASLYFANGGLGQFGSSSAIAMSDSKIKTPYTQSYNLTVEREITKDMVATVAYVGNNSKHTFAGTNPLAPLAITSNSDHGNTNVFPGIGLNNADQQWIGESKYNSLQAKLEKRFSDGLSFLASYTWSHAMDDASNPGIGGGPSYRNTNLIPLQAEFTNSNYDTRHRVTVNGLYELPFGKSRKYAHEGGVLDYIVGGWSTSLTWVAQSGIPFTVNAGGGSFAGAKGFGQYNAIKISDPFKGGGTVDPRNIDMAGQTCPAQVKTKANWYNPCAFIDPAPGASITVGQRLTSLADAIKYSGSRSNQIVGPGYERINMSMFKNFKTWREQYIQFRADAFNLFNHPTWGQPSTDPNTGSMDLSLASGSITGPQTFQANTPDARFFQLAAKYVF
jgi:hypothetical protein